MAQVGMAMQIHGPNHQSMDWFKGKFSPESPIFNGKIYGFL
jgi:hypothetical protein